MDAGPIEVDGGMVGDAGPAPAAASGRVSCWGNGQSPLRPTDGMRSASQITLGAARCFIDDGELLCLGQNDDGELGDGTTEDRERAVGLPTLRRAEFVQTSRFGDQHFTCAIAEGDVWCWGAGDRGQLGDRTTDTRSTPARVRGISAATALTLGAEHACVLEGGQPFCWGAGTLGQLGNDMLFDQDAPVPVELTDVVAIAAGGYHTCAVTSDGTVHCWGDSSQGQLGVAIPGDDGFSTPIPIFGLADAASVAAAAAHPWAPPATPMFCRGANYAALTGASGVDCPPPPVQPRTAHRRP